MVCLAASKSAEMVASQCYREPAADAALASDEELLDVGDDCNDDMFGESRQSQLDTWRREHVSRPQNTTAAVRKGGQTAARKVTYHLQLPLGCKLILLHLLR